MHCWHAAVTVVLAVDDVPDIAGMQAVAGMLTVAIVPANATFMRLLLNACCFCMPVVVACLPFLECLLLVESLLL